MLSYQRLAKRGRPNNQNLGNVDIDSWTVYRSLNNLFEFLLKIGKIQQFPTCGVGHLKIVRYVAKLNQDSQAGREEDQVLENQNQESLQNFQDQAQVLLKIFKKIFQNMSDFVFKMFKKKNQVFFFQQQLKEIQFDYEGNATFDKLKIYQEIKRKIQQYESEIFDIGLQEKRINVSNIDEIESCKARYRQNKELYVRLCKLKYYKTIQLVCVQLSDDILNMLEYIALKQIEDMDYKSDDLLREIQEQEKVQEQFNEFIECCSVRNFLKDALEIQEKLISKDEINFRYENLQKQINNFQSKACTLKYSEDLKQKTIEQTLKSDYFLKQIKEIFDCVQQIQQLS